MCPAVVLFSSDNRCSELVACRTSHDVMIEMQEVIRSVSCRGNVMSTLLSISRIRKYPLTGIENFVTRDLFESAGGVEDSRCILWF